MPFVPRSQLEQKQQAAAPPNMPVVENFQAKQPIPDHSIPHDNTEEQIAELNELLIHVLDELADMKQVLRTTATHSKRRPKPSSKRRPPSDDEEDTTSPHASNQNTKHRNQRRITCKRENKSVRNNRLLQSKTNIHLRC